MPPSRAQPRLATWPPTLALLLLGVTLGSAAAAQVNQNDRKTLEEYMYDYYAYPHLFEGEEPGQEEGGFKHVTYVNNGAVISRPQSAHLRSSTSSVTGSVSTEAAVEAAVKASDAAQPEAEPHEDEALVFLNPLLDAGNSDQFASPVVDFDETLTGMMGALAEIQKKGDSMLGSIRRQKGVLDQLDSQVVVAERRRQEAELEAEHLEEAKLQLEEAVKGLEQERDAMTKQMQQEEFQMAKIKTDLAPLLSEVSQRKSELLSFENSINTRKSELENYQKQIDKVSQDLSELKDGVAVTVPGSSSSPLLLAGLALSVLFNLVVGGYVLTQVAAARRVDSRVSQFVGAADTALADSITGFLDGFESGQLEGGSRWEEFRPSEQQHGAGSEDREYYTYSELPRAAY